jgi:hypothetical protein
MINHGYITPTVVRGAQIGVKHYSEDQDAAQARQ